MDAAARAAAQPEEGSTPMASSRYKRNLAEAFPASSAASRPPPSKPHLEADERLLTAPLREPASIPRLRGQGADTVAISAVASMRDAGATAPAAPAPAPATAAAAAAAVAASAGTPWGSGVSEALDFCRDGEALLTQLQQRIRETGQQLAAAAAAAESSEHEGQVQPDKPAETGKKTEQQMLLEREVEECFTQLAALRRLLLAVTAAVNRSPLLTASDETASATTAREKTGDPRGEAASKVMRLFKLNQLVEAEAAAPASAVVGVLRGIKRVVSALAEWIHNVENSASVWLTHGGEVLPYLQHLQQSLNELKDQQEQTAQKRREVTARLEQRRQQVDAVRFRLEKTQDEFRLARLDLTREELEKIPGAERMQLLESRQVREALDRELKSLAAFSPLFIVERAAKYITLQYRPENSSVDHEISIEGLDLSFTRGVTRISPFFSVHVQPPNNRVRLLLERGIRELLQKLSTDQASARTRMSEGEDQGRIGIHAADDVVVEHIAAILIKKDSVEPKYRDAAPWLSMERSLTASYQLAGAAHVPLPAEYVICRLYGHNHISRYTPTSLDKMNATAADLSWLPGDTDEQLAIGLRIVSNAYKSRVQTLDNEIRQLKAQSAERGEQVAILQKKCSALEVQLIEQTQRGNQLVEENKQLLATTRKLQKDIQRLENLKKAVLTSIQEDRPDTDDPNHVRADQNLRSARQLLKSLFDLLLRNMKLTHVALATLFNCSCKIGAVDDVNLKGLRLDFRRGSGAHGTIAARSRLSFETFNAFLASIKRLNNQQEDREETLRTAERLFGMCHLSLPPLIKSRQQVAIDGFLAQMLMSITSARACNCDAAGDANADLFEEFKALLTRHV
ncbi:hypothetical protein Emed_002759 [Eimeria media]